MLGMVAFGLAVVGTIFAVWDGAFAVGWALLPVAFILSIIALFIKGKGKKLGVAALVLSVLGTIAGMIAFAVSATAIVDDEVNPETTVSTAPSEAPGETPTEVEPTTPAEPSAEDEAAEPTPTGDVVEGTEFTRSNPAPLGTTVSSEEWEVTVNSFTPNSTAEVMAENQFNDEVTVGNEYALVNLTAKRLGEDSAFAYEITVDYVTETGNVVGAFDAIAIAPDDFDSVEELFEGAETTGNVALMVPVDDAGVIRIRPGMFADEVFFATS